MSHTSSYHASSSGAATGSSESSLLFWQVRFIIIIIIIIIHNQRTKSTVILNVRLFVCPYVRHVRDHLNFFTACEVALLIYSFVFWAVTDGDDCF